MKEQFIIMSSNYRRPVSSIFKKSDGTLGAEKQNPPNISYVASQKNVYKKHKNFV